MVHITDHYFSLLQGSRLTFQLASPVASGGFDPLAKANFSLARRRTFFSFKIPIHDFHEQNNSFHLNSIRSKDRNWCYNYIGSTTITEVFPSGRNCHTTSQLAAEKHSFLSKCRFTISREHNNSFHYNLFPSCKHKHRYYIDVIQIFENLRFLIVWKRVWPPDAACMKHDP